MQKKWQNVETQYVAVRKLDVIVYALVLLAVVCLFSFFVIIPKTEPNSGFKVQVDGKDIFYFYYETNTYRILDGYDVSIENDGSVFFVNVATENGFNLLQVDTDKKEVRIIDSDCSNTHDCVYFAPIKDSNGVIVCVPHGLVVTPLGDGFVPPVAG
ncbi:MAG: hypothetical protein E7369_02135 [Clostridiales bacterium]|nr:hypothetical protein [Clostridiales bacterium]